MSPAESAARGRGLLAERVAAAPDAVARVPEILAPLLERPGRLPRCLVTTGIGTSEGHARHLAELAARMFGQPARFASTGSLAAGAPPGAGEDWLVVFSQGLSANARHAFRDVEAWGGVVLVTGLSPAAAASKASAPDAAAPDRAASEITTPDMAASGLATPDVAAPDEAAGDALPAEKRAWLEALERRGVVRIGMECGPEYGLLIRVIGARVGYAIAWSLLRTLALRRLASPAPLAIAASWLEQAQQGAVAEAERVLPRGQRLADFFAPERALLIVGEAGTLELCEHLPLKLAEGMLRPQPRTVDVLHFAHGPLQAHFERPLSILYLAPGTAPPGTAPGKAAVGAAPRTAPAAPSAATASGSEGAWLARLEAALDPARHDLRCVRTQLPLPFAAVELEAIFDAWILRHQEETGTDLVVWPGTAGERERGASPGPLAEVALERATWPELERALAHGRRTAIVALGSIEQHGPHLPLATDRWIADALAESLARRVGDAIALPALPFGCASEHLDFPGTLHLEPSTLEALLRDLLGSLVRHGFMRAFVFTAHGGNVGALCDLEDRLAACAAPLALRIAEVDTGRLQAAIVAAGGLDARAAGLHAGEYETSVVAWLEPGSVRQERRAAGPLVDPDSVAPSLFYPSLRPNAPQGVVGDPTRASRERGAAYLAAWVDALEADYRAAFGVVDPAGSGPEKKRK